jgi:hypothetical protein
MHSASNMARMESIHDEGEPEPQARSDPLLEVNRAFIAKRKTE